MNVRLTPEQESLVHAKVATGKYQSTEQVIEVAFRLLEEYERAESEWAMLVREKVQAAIDRVQEEPSLDGELFVSGILERFKKE
ncbi:type II toxin-antitoxin system ParD family antitoxin [Laspinema sp. A4]|uniref:ribbon-helix-helix domain-containing protein n=1 Tax=Laspinema sp. D2d TaxID=2953686 RepID=UPI0021BAFADD|nr:type II toxin-antitoxin system ParD family antitoxin [Laspinema sp. D2d]MCT7984725.1 type II toxin-antitoxin system ParD family antitoxin [Laspinema sp. D2d]